MYSMNPSFLQKSRPANERHANVQDDRRGVLALGEAQTIFRRVRGVHHVAFTFERHGKGPREIHVIVNHQDGLCRRNDAKPIG